MKKLQKQKSKLKPKSTSRATRVKRKKLFAHHLGIILAAFLLLEGLLVTQTQAQDWQAGITVLDASGLFDQPAQDLAEVFAPQFAIYQQVSGLYSYMTDAMEELLDLNHAFDEVSNIWLGVNEFYEQSADEMGILLGLPQVSMERPMVSGTFISH